jgi:hypothetical protein
MFSVDSTLLEVATMAELRLSEAVNQVLLESQVEIANLNFLELYVPVLMIGFSMKTQILQVAVVVLESLE